jgi:mRNA-degrading endonuclease RelE of RelBE toxin-antitoxin system
VAFLDLPPDIQGDVASCLTHRLNRLFDDVHVSLSNMEPPYDVRELLESINPTLPLVMVDTKLLAKAERELSEDVVTEYMEVWETGEARFPPVVIDSEDEDGVLCEGGHRSFSAFRAGVPAIQAVDIAAIDATAVRRSLPLPYRIVMSPEAAREYGRLGKGDQRQIDGLLNRLTHWPEVSGASPLWGPGHGQFRMKTRGLRMVFRVDTAPWEITIDRIADRSTIYEEYH